MIKEPCDIASTCLNLKNAEKPACTLHKVQMHGRTGKSDHNKDIKLATISFSRTIFY